MNDELTKDEIVTVSSGNIKSYEEIASAQLPDGRSTVTLNAVVCISKLVSYAKSKGASTEFAGATFAMNMKMYELNKRNESIAFEHLLKQIKMLLPDAFDRYLEIKEPRVNKYDESNYDLEFIVKVKCNGTMEIINNLIRSTLSSLVLSKKEVESYKKTGIEVFPLIYSSVANASSSTSVEDFENYHPEDPCYGRPDRGGRKAAFVDYSYTKVLYFRNPFVLYAIMDEIAREISNFVITDNTGQKSTPTTGIFAKSRNNRLREGQTLVRIEREYHDSPVNYHIPIRGYADMVRIIAKIPKDDIKNTVGLVSIVKTFKHNNTRTTNIAYNENNRNNRPEEQRKGCRHHE